MSSREDAFVFKCGGEDLIGVVAAPMTTDASTGVLVVVGGPQYRVGSHRQFTLLSRELAESGIPCMRFDYRGMGDASGAERGFQEVGDDIKAAIDTFVLRLPTLKNIVLWGLCDGATAASFYAPQDARVGGLILLNPWVKTERSQAKVLLKHYYLQRLFSFAFWKKLFSGQVHLGNSLSSFWQLLHFSRKSSTGVRSSASAESQSLPERMAGALASVSIPYLILLSGRDYVAREFEEACQSHAKLRDTLGSGSIERIADADHTFSSSVWRARVCEITAQWVSRLSAKDEERGECD